MRGKNTLSWATTTPREGHAWADTKGTKGRHNYYFYYYYYSPNHAGPGGGHTVAGGLVHPRVLLHQRWDVRGLDATLQQQNTRSAQPDKSHNKHQARLDSKGAYCEQGGTYAGEII